MELAPPDDLAPSDSEIGSLNLACGCWNFPVCHYKLISVFLCYCQGGANRSVQASKSPGKQLETQTYCSVEAPWARLSTGVKQSCFASSTGPSLGNLACFWCWAPLENGWCVSECTALSCFYFLVCSAFDALGIPLPIAVCLWKDRECQCFG